MIVFPRASPEAVKSIAAMLVSAPNPLPTAAFKDEAAQLGWELLSEERRSLRLSTHFGFSLDVVNTLTVGDHVEQILVPLTDVVGEGSEGAAAGDVITAHIDFLPLLTEAIGERPVKEWGQLSHHWDLEDGRRITLRSIDQVVLELLSPRLPSVGQMRVRKSVHRSAPPQ